MAIPVVWQKLWMTRAILTFDLLTLKWSVIHRILMGCICARYGANPSLRYGAKVWILPKNWNEPCDTDLWPFDLLTYMLQAFHKINVWCKCDEYLTIEIWLKKDVTDGPTDGEINRHNWLIELLAIAKNTYWLSILLLITNLYACNILLLLVTNILLN